MYKLIINSSPLIALGKCDQLDLLKVLFGEVIIPGAVFREVSAKSDVKTYIINSLDWIHVKAIENKAKRLMFKPGLHEGEVEVMILAQEIHANMVLIDDQSARKAASSLGIPVGGTMGILLTAKAAGFIPSVTPLIEEMVNNGIFLSPKLIAEVRKKAGE